MYTMPPGLLPMTGFDMVGVGIVGAALIFLGFLALRAAYFSRSK
jgi:LPXTG-motif cell wall-anchored protein